MNHKQPSTSSLKEQKIFIAHSNLGLQLKSWHKRREESARRLGYNLSTFAMSEAYPYTIFPCLEKSWRRRDPDLMKFYDDIGSHIDECDVFIHFNGVNIHPEFLAQFNCVKIYHCADDPDASKNISKPVAGGYDICAISNPACMNMYKEWGCDKVIFWPIGSFHHIDHSEDTAKEGENIQRDIPIAFVGSKYGVTRFRYVHKVPLLNKMSAMYYKKSFFENIEREFPNIRAYGSMWSNGYIDDDKIVNLYRRSQLGINVHNSLGPVNARLYDLAAFGVCQICDNKNNLHHVFELGKEIVGFESREECIDLLHYYLKHPEEARAIGEAARQRYLRDYTIDAIWKNLFSKIESLLPRVTPLLCR